MRKNKRKRLQKLRLEKEAEVEQRRFKKACANLKSKKWKNRELKAKNKEAKRKLKKKLDKKYSPSEVDKKVGGEYKDRYQYWE